MRLYVRLIIIILPFMLIANGCATVGSGLGGINLISEEEEIELGKQLSEEIDKEMPVLDNPVLTAYVDRIGQRLASHSARPDVPYSFKIIDNDEEINAFALPGGPIYVYTGLMKHADNEAELAGVLGHEVAHIVARHSTEQLTKAYGIQLVAALVLGEDPNALAAVAGDLASNLGMLKFSRSDEIEADRLGVRYMFREGYSPNAMTSFQQKLGQLHSSDQSRAMNLLSTHPLSQDRLDAIRHEISLLPPGRPVRYEAERYKLILERELK